MNRLFKFTLIELLVVVAILALLISFLSPSVARVIESARVTSCASSERQLGLAIALYHGDYLKNWDAGNNNPVSHDLTTQIKGWQNRNLYNYNQSLTISAFETSSIKIRSPWQIPYVEHGYLDANNDNAYWTDSEMPILRDPGIKDYSISKGWGRVNSMYPYLIRAGSAGTDPNAHCRGFYGWAYRRNHPDPENALMTFCPSAYPSNPGQATFGKGWYVTSHYWKYDGDPFNSTAGLMNYDYLSSMWKGSNLLFGDGSVRWAHPDNTGENTATNRADYTMERGNQQFGNNIMVYPNGYAEHQGGNHLWPVGIGCERK